MILSITTSLTFQRHLRPPAPGPLLQPPLGRPPARVRRGQPPSLQQDRRQLQRRRWPREVVVLLAAAAAAPTEGAAQVGVRVVASPKRVRCPDDAARL